MEILTLITISQINFLNIIKSHNAFATNNENLLIGEQNALNDNIKKYYEKYVFDKNKLPNFLMLFNVFNEDKNIHEYFIIFVNEDEELIKNENVVINKLYCYLEHFYKNIKKQKECNFTIVNLLVREYDHEYFIEYLEYYFDFCFKEIMNTNYNQNNNLYLN